MNHSDRLRLTYSLLIAFCLAISLACLTYPLYVIRPFRPQGERELRSALLILRVRPILALPCAAAALFGAVRYWRLQPRKWLRIGAIAGVAGVLLCAALFRVNVYERFFFQPLGTPSFASAGEAKLDGGEMVIAISLSGTARAYPIRNVSYHHIVNDVVDSVPIVATY
jgi:hypothetical protein